MRDIVALAFGREPGDREARTPDDDYGHTCGVPSPVRGDWCQTQPGDAALARLGAIISARRAAAAARTRGRP